MSNRARKERKAAGERFQHPAKAGTPVVSRQFRSARKFFRALDDRGLIITAQEPEPHPTTPLNEMEKS